MVNRKSAVPKRDQIASKKAEILDLWRFQYTRRRFWKDHFYRATDREQILAARKQLTQFAQSLIHPSNFELLLDPNLSYLLDDYDERCRAAFSGAWQNRYALSAYLSDAAIIYYHNTLSSDPKYVCYDFRYSAVKYTVEKIVKSCQSEINLLRNVAYRYGFFDTDLTKRQCEPNAIEILKSIVNDESMPQPHDNFPKETDDEDDDCRFNYAGLNEKFFEEERPHFLYLYFDALDYSFDTEDESQKILGYIKRYKQQPSWGNKDIANIQICIRMKSRKITDKEVQQWCYYGLVKFRRFSGFPTTSKNDEQIKSVVDGHRHDLVSPQSRAIGLALWDGIHLEGKTLREMELELSDALNEPVHDAETREKYTAHIRGTSVYSQFEKDLRLAEYCIENMEALTMEDKKQKRKWKPNIEIEKSRSTREDIKK